MTEAQLLNLHKYLHDPTIKFVTFGTTKVPIYENRERLRFAQIEGVKYIQQNPRKDTAYGKMAQNGHKITWGIRDGKWDLVIDEKIRVLNGTSTDRSG